MLRRIPLPVLFVLAAIVTMVLAAGAVWQFALPADVMLRALAPTWIGIACVFWVLWRQIPPPGEAAATPRPVPSDPPADVERLRLDRRYEDISRLPLTGLDYVVVAVETTGPNTEDGDNDGDEAIVQIGAVRITGGEIIAEDTFERLVNPGRPIAAAATRFHGITDDRVADAPEIEPVLAAFRDYTQDTVLIGHNIGTGFSLINRTGSFGNPVLDTMLLSIGAFEARHDHTLDALAAHFDEPVHDRHSAPDDAHLTARVFLRLVPELDRVGARRFGDAQDLCAHSAERLRDLGIGR